MSTSQPKPDLPTHIQAATDAVVEFALISLQPRFHLWEPRVNLRIAEMIWNFTSLDSGSLQASSAKKRPPKKRPPKKKALKRKPAPQQATERSLPCSCRPDTDFDEIIDVLAEARHRRWSDQAGFIFDLRVRHQRGELVFCFDLSLDEGESFIPCEILVDSPLAGWLPSPGEAGREIPGGLRTQHFRQN